MRQEFLKAILPSQGVYCAVAIEPNDKKIHQRFFESFDELAKQFDDCNGLNVYVAPNSFKDYSRQSSHAAWAKSFFVDLDVGPTKPYQTKQEAIDNLNEFINKTGLPPAVIIDSGTGIHGYWPLDVDVPIDEWRPYAKLFKQFCISNGLQIDVAVTADAARIMRCPDTYNYKTDPPNKAYIISEEIHVYDFNEFKTFLGELPPDPLSVLAGVERGVDEESRSVYGENYEASFGDIVMRGAGQFPGELGCDQINYIVNNTRTLSYDLWYSALSIAARCTDSETAIHLLSEDYDGYSKENTEFKARETLKATGPRTCDYFDQINPGVCDACPHRNKITTPLELGRRLKTPTPTVEEIPGTGLALITGSIVPAFPKEIHPFLRGNTGGVYIALPPDEDGTPSPPIQLLPYDLYPVKRMLSPKYGECMMMNYDTPHDGKKEYILNLDIIYSTEHFAKVVLSSGVAFDRKHITHMMDYHKSWFVYMQRIKAAEDMQMQMGFTDDNNGFVLGSIELRHDGTERPVASSPYVKSIAKLLVPAGEYGTWRRAADYLNAPSMEIHAFAMMCAFGSPLMQFTSVSGVCVSLYGPKGVAKTGAMYGCLGVYGDPKELNVTKATDNADTQRLLTLHNIPYGRDEVSNMDPLTLSNLIHSISSGKSKIRLMSTADEERPLERNASLIAIFTSNHAVEAKLELIKANPEGEMARLVELFVDKKPVLFENDPALSTFIFNTFKVCYGHAGPMYIKYVYKLGLNNVAIRLDNWTTRFRKSFGNDSAYRFYENLIAATFAGTEIANEAGIIKFDLDRIYDVVMRHICSMRDSVPINDFDYGSVIGEYIHKNTQNTLMFHDSRVVCEPRGELKIRVDVDEGTQIVSKADFKKYLATMQISPREFEMRAKKENLLTDLDRQRLSKGWRNGNTTPLIRVYEFKANISNVIKDIVSVPSITK